MTDQRPLLLDAHPLIAITLLLAAVLTVACGVVAMLVPLAAVLR